MDLGVVESIYLQTHPLRDKPMTDRRDDVRGDRKFEVLVVEAIEVGLSNVLGESAKDALFHHLEKTCGLKRHEVSSRVDDFARKLETLLGPGAEVLERAIVNDLYNRLSIESEEVGGFGFADYIERARKKILERRG